jgi:hypothetical protein
MSYYNLCGIRSQHREKKRGGVHIKKITGMQDYGIVNAR